MSLPLLAVSVGCPCGIGPEVAVSAAVRLTRARAVLVGDPRVIADAAALRLDCGTLRLIERARDLRGLRPGELAVLASSAPLAGPLTPGSPDAAAGRAQLAWIDKATELVRSGAADALVTGPVSKSAVAHSGARGAASFLGHTEHLQRRLRAKEVVMAFWSERLITSLVTTHLALRDVPRAITPRAVASAAYWTARLVCALGAGPRRVAVTSLNPHAGEGGLLGDEELRAIAPGIRAAERRVAAEALRVELVGPVGAETAMRKGLASEASAARRFDAVVAMYHDQATIPSKLVAFGDAVNVTLGLPIVRTSVDHGTGYDIAWSGVADDAGMFSALELAARLARARRPPTCAA